MVEEVLSGILTYASNRSPELIEFSWDLVRKAFEERYYLLLRIAEPEADEFDFLSKIDRDAMPLFWKRMPQKLAHQQRIYFIVLPDPLEVTAGDALAKELNPLGVGIQPIDESKPGARKPMEEVRIFRLLRYIWERPEVVDGIFAAYTWELSWPWLDEVRCTFDEMLADMYHWFDHRGWSDKTYYVKKCGRR